MRGPTSSPTSSRWAAWPSGSLFALAAGRQALGAAAARRGGRASACCGSWPSPGEWMFKQEAMGGGDIKMMAMVGAFLGWQGTLLTVFLGRADRAA